MYLYYRLDRDCAYQLNYACVQYPSSHGERHAAYAPSLIWEDVEGTIGNEREKGGVAERRIEMWRENI